MKPVKYPVKRCPDCGSRMRVLDGTLWICIPCWQKSRRLSLDHHVGSLNRTTMERLCDASGLDGIGSRAVRAIISDCDGVDFVVSFGDDGVYVIEYAEQADRGTRRLRAQATAMDARAERRQAFVEKNLRRRQERMAL